MAETPLRPGPGEGQAGAGSDLSNRHQPLATAAGPFIPLRSFFKPGDYISQRAMQGQDVRDAQALGHFLPYIRQLRGFSPSFSSSFSLRLVCVDLHPQPSWSWDGPWWTASGRRREACYGDFGDLGVQAP
ncbi:uncharacterized protein [Notamacropus eugenii]|uniref:uncharacterized protein n=1 Tax=Notamacropus eugenii TaxID=9315 RepID=UPI003B6838FF